ncbi:MAG: RsmE family RNA methyltransferase [Acholeplasmataceae bacterium]|jgi:16S rRNA (uracil1498-N3)-methyltransferase|nr:RsmE family RNA methyltransferase [Acholeplasmataceae bacterium]
MQRYFLKTKSNEITGPDAHHITKVMRMSSHDQIIVCYEKRCFLSEVLLEDSRVFFKEIKELESVKSPYVALIQGLPKHPKSETVCKYATLFGASKITFVPMQRSIAKLDNENNKLKRMHLIAKEAAELAHRFDIPDITFESALKHIDWKQFNIVLLADENEKTLTLPIACPSIKEDDRIALIIGPEGGITDQERAYFEQQGAKMVSLGKNILPTELAALYALSYVSLKNF